LQVAGWGSNGKWGLACWMAAKKGGGYDLWGNFSLVDGFQNQGLSNLTPE